MIHALKTYQKAKPWDRWNPRQNPKSSPQQLSRHDAPIHPTILPSNTRTQ